MTTKQLIKFLKKVGKIKFKLPKPRSKANHIWQRIKKDVNKRTENK